MATNTPKFNLVKPSLDDAANIEVLNDNFDKIDERMLTVQEIVSQTKSNREESILGIDDSKFITPYTLKETLRNGGGGVQVINNVFKKSSDIYTFVATESTNKFTVEELDNTKELEVFYKNLTLLKGKQFEVARESKECILSFQLEAGEEIDYRIISTSYDYDDLVNKPLKDVSITKSCKDEDGIFTVLEEKVEGKLYKRYELGGKDSGGNYKVQTIVNYKEDGTTVKGVELWDIGYDEEGNVISEVKRDA